MRLRRTRHRDKENAPQDNCDGNRRGVFNRKKSSTRNAHGGNSQTTDQQLQSSSQSNNLQGVTHLSTVPRPHFSSLSEMTILHNSNVPDIHKNGKGSGEGGSNDSEKTSNSKSSSPYTPPSPSYVSSQTRNVMRFALQSRMYDERQCNSKLSTQQTIMPSGCCSAPGTIDRHNSLPGYISPRESTIDDPTVEESIECVFGHQLEEGLEMNVDDDEYYTHLPPHMTSDSTIDEEYAYDSYMITPPISNDSDYSGATNRFGAEYASIPMKRYSSGKIIQVGSVSPYPKQDGEEEMNKKVLPKDGLHHSYHSHKDTGENSNLMYDSKSTILDGGDGKNQEEGRPRSHTSSAKCNGNVRDPSSANVKESKNLFHCQTCIKEGNKFGKKFNPASEWPQYPLLLRPSPGSGTRIRGIRYADSMDYIMDSTCETNWWEKKSSMNSEDGSKIPFCAECCPCPINNGNEEMNCTLVVDFESDIFEGTLQLRIRHSSGSNLEAYDDTKGYFNGLNRHYQSLIQGRFKKEGIPMTTCLAGQTFSRPLVLPAPYIAKGALKVLRFLAPRMIAKIDCKKPYALSPLGSTPQVVCVDGYDGSGDFKANGTITGILSEPVDNSNRLIHVAKASSLQSSASRAKARKKAFDKLCAEKDESLTFQTDRVYTFEFLQHLMNFERLEVSLGSILGKFKLGPVMNGQPIHLQALRQISYGKDPSFEGLWSFELWHKDIIDQYKDDC